jgi:hypothetical protein
MRISGEVQGRSVIFPNDKFLGPIVCFLEDILEFGMRGNPEKPFGNNVLIQ